MSQVKSVYTQFLKKMTTELPGLERRLLTLQTNYVQSLPESDRQLLVFYNYKGDELLNPFLRNNNQIPSDFKVRRTESLNACKKFTNKGTAFYTQLESLRSSNPTTILNALLWLSATLHRILYEAPRLSTSFYVARGVQTYYNETSKSFLSASIHPEAAQSFAASEFEESTGSALCKESTDPRLQFVKSFKVRKQTPFLYLPAILTAMPACTPSCDTRQIEVEWEVIFSPGVEITLIRDYVLQSEKGNYIPQPYASAGDTLCGFSTYEIADYGGAGTRSPYSIGTTRKQTKTKRGSRVSGSLRSKRTKRTKKYTKKVFLGGR